MRPLCRRPVDIDVPALSSPTADPAPRSRQQPGLGQTKSGVLVSSKGGSCDLHAAVWNGEAVAVKIVRGDDAASVNDLLLEAMALGGKPLPIATSSVSWLRVCEQMQGPSLSLSSFSHVHDILPRPPDCSPRRQTLTTR